MINFFYFIFFLSFLFSENCINNLYNSILKNIDKDIFKIDVLADVYTRDNNSYYKTIDLSLFVTSTEPSLTPASKPSLLDLTLNFVPNTVI